MKSYILLLALSVSVVCHSQPVVKSASEQSADQKKMQRLHVATQTEFSITSVDTLSSSDITDIKYYDREGKLTRDVMPEQDADSLIVEYTYHDGVLSADKLLNFDILPVNEFYTYDAQGLPLKVVTTGDDPAEYHFEYDAQGRMTRESSTTTYAETDDNGNPTGKMITEESYSETYEYNADGQLVRALIDDKYEGTFEVRYHYNPDGSLQKLEEATYNEDTKTAIPYSVSVYTYDDKGLLTEERYIDAETGEAFTYKYTYSYYPGK